MDVYTYTFASLVKCVFEPSKEEMSKTVNAKNNTRIVFESALNSTQGCEEIFSIFIIFF